ncbi:MAG: glutamine--fructose-6-phosphate aminotransferase, partial [Proteobacteria bacterium]|nr:glutamine--fructose-6-phosphate aminotransferase [Pseudomonadota bacterium]
MIVQGRRLFDLIKKLSKINFEMATSIHQARENTVIFFPNQPNVLSCGISAFIAFKGDGSILNYDLNQTQDMVFSLKTKILPMETQIITEQFLGGDILLNSLFEMCQDFKQEDVFCDLFFDTQKKNQLILISDTIEELIKTQKTLFKHEIANLSSADADIIASRIEKLQDI